MTTIEPRIHDKQGALERKGPLKLDLGCGTAKRNASYVGVDLLDHPAVDVVGDVYEVLRSLPPESVAEIFCSHLLEHLPDVPALVNEAERVLVTRGRLHAVVPHFSNPYYYSDPTHRQPFGLYSFSYLAEDPLLRRRVPLYGRTPRLRLERVELGFRSATEFPLRHRIRHLIGRVLNRSVWLQELYEESLTGFLPCYEVRFELVKMRPAER